MRLWDVDDGNSFCSASPSGDAQLKWLPSAKRLSQATMQIGAAAYKSQPL